MTTVPDLIVHRHDALQHQTTRRYKVVLIPGNPGLIGYYASFLDQLYSLLQASNISIEGGIQFEVIGRSLHGFETGSQSLKEMRATERRSKPRKLPLGLQDQIDFVKDFIQSLHDTDRSEQSSVILIGHSVGAFMLLEILRNCRLQGSHLNEARWIGGICLFPTVVDIQKSLSGQRLGWLLNLPCFAVIVAWLVQLINFIVPDALLQEVVRKFTRFPRDAAVTTTAFLQSRFGVRQALHMAKDEMNEIKADSWDETIWGSPSVRPPKLCFYFGGSDHWVADRTRDELIAKRGQQVGEDADWKPRMEVDKNDVPHGFCIRHSSSIAKICATQIENIVAADLREATQR